MDTSGNSIEAIFPGLSGTSYQVTSPADDEYNCIAWAAGVTDAWWWPDPGGVKFWPVGARRDESLGAFGEAFASLGYEVCLEEQFEAGLEKVALFAGADGFPLHAARQLSNGRWTSKLGELEDIEHDLHALEGTEYGSVVLLMRRPRAAENPELPAPNPTA